MTRYNFLSDLLMSHPENREAIGKGWPLFFYLIFNMKKDNKLITTYAELKEGLNESPNTIKTWREHLVERKVAKVFKGSKSMTFILLPPYDSLVTCEQNDEAQIKMVGDPAVKSILNQLTAYNNMPILPLLAKMEARIDDLNRKIS